LIVVPVLRVMLERARILPAKSVVVPKVAELPTCQKTLAPFPPFVNKTDELLAVVNVLPIWNTKTEEGSARELRVSAPVN